MLDFLKKRKYLLLVLFYPFQAVWYFILDATARERSTFLSIHIHLDDLIPFIPVFAVFYYIWFAYLAFGVLFTGLTDREEFIKMMIFLMIEITLTLTFSTIVPNGHDFRPEVTGKEGVFEWLVFMIYKNDPACATIMPSMHVMNAIGTTIGLSRSKKIKNNIWIKSVLWIYTVLVTLSTVFVKQHSILDVFVALGVALVVYLIVYVLKPFDKLIYKEVNKKALQG